MTGGTLIIGGEADGDRYPMRLAQVQVTVGKEKYILVGFKEGNMKHTFYMLTGMVPAEAMKRYKVLADGVK